MKNFTLIIFLLFITQISFSQPFEGGFFAGMTASQVDGDTYGGFNKIGLTAGGYITKKINRNANWKAELRYIQKGAYSGPSEQNLTLFKLIIHYVEIPIMYQYKIHPQIIIDAGISPDIYLFHREESEYGDDPPDDSEPYHRFGLNGNIGVYYTLKENIMIGARSSYSMIPMRDHAGSVIRYWWDRGQHNNVIGFTIYYHFK